MKIYLLLEHNNYDGMVEEVYAFSTDEKRQEFILERAKIHRNKELKKYNLPSDLEIGNPLFSFQGYHQIDETYYNNSLKRWAREFTEIEVNLL